MACPAIGDAEAPASVAEPSIAASVASEVVVLPYSRTTFRLVDGSLPGTRRNWRH
jgi:hypothetical protein